MAPLVLIIKTSPTQPPSACCTCKDSQWNNYQAWNNCSTWLQYMPLNYAYMFKFLFIIGIVLTCSTSIKEEYLGYAFYLFLF